MAISNTLITPPALEPVSLAELKAHARISHSNEDDLLSALIAAARAWCEAYTKRTFIEQTFRASLSVPPAADFIILPSCPLARVEKIESFDDQDQGTLFAASKYYVDNENARGRVVLRDGASWPEATRVANGLVVTYVAGYGEEAADVPDPIRLAIKQLAAHWYEHRGEAVVGGAVSSVPMTTEAILRPYRILSAGAL